MTARNIAMATGLADPRVIDLQAYRLATFGKHRPHGRPRTENVGPIAADWREGADVLADKIDRLLDQVVACLADDPLQVDA